MENGNMNKRRASQKCNRNEKGESDSQRDLQRNERKQNLWARLLRESCVWDNYVYANLKKTKQEEARAALWGPGDKTLPIFVLCEIAVGVFQDTIIPMKKWGFMVCQIWHALVYETQLLNS